MGSNSLGHMFCESLCEFLTQNKQIRKLDISSNFIDENNASTLRNAIECSPNVIEIDIRNNQFNDETVEDISQLAIKNFLESKNIPYKKI